MWPLACILFPSDGSCIPPPHHDARPTCWTGPASPSRQCWASGWDGRRGGKTGMLNRSPGMDGD